MITCNLENGDKVGFRHVTTSVIVVKDNKILLCRRGTYNGKPILESGKWALIGGFVDRDETLTEAAKREVMEETGCVIDNLKLLRIVSNPDRPNDNDRQNFSMIFIADCISQNSKDNEEVKELKWFDVESLPPPPQIAFDFAEDLDLYQKYLKEKFPIPVY